jgi:chemotaxis protein MotB
MAEDSKKDKPKEEEKSQPIIIKKINKGGGHHGGAWKVAYADFVTAMMAFFLLLWLLNVSTDEQLNAISNYFDPTHPKVSKDTSGAGGVMGGLSMSPQGAMATNVQTISSARPSGSAVNNKSASKSTEGKDSKEMALEKAKEMMRKEEEKKFKEAQDKIKQAIESDPELKELSKNLLVDMTPEGLRIQIVDQEGKPMFASGSARMFDKTAQLIKKVSEVIKAMPNEISIRGHTDSVPYGPGAEYTNWELSSDRANATRRVMLESALPQERLNNVVGKADTDHLVPDKPNDPTNRRISIILLKEELTNPDYDKDAEAVVEDQGLLEDFEGDDGSSGAAQQPIGTFQKTPGSVEFP